MRQEKVHLITLILSATLIAMACAREDDPSSYGSGTTSMLDQPLLDLTSKLMNSVNRTKNVIVSPISIHEALSMVLLGADLDTETERELINVLGLAKLDRAQMKHFHEEYSGVINNFKKITKKSRELYKERRQAEASGENPHRIRGSRPPILDIFNIIISKQAGSMLPAYADSVSRYHNSSIVMVKEPEAKMDLLTRLEAWSKEAGFKEPIMTNKELSGEFAAIILSAISVEGFWFADFSEGEVEEKAFHNYGRANEPVSGVRLYKGDPNFSRYLEFTSADQAEYKFLQDRLSKSSSSAAYDKLRALNMHVVEVPLEGGLKFSIFEPRGLGGSGGELDALAGKLFEPDRNSGTTNLSRVFALLDSDLGENMVHSLSLPKFNFESGIQLKSALWSMGLRRVFDEANAEISNMTSNKLFVSKIVHQAMIDVNKFGIKAAGVTKITLNFLSAMIVKDPISVHIKNPFIFVLRYKSLPLFVGQLVHM